MKLLIFGTGLFYKNRKEVFKDEEIVAFIDNDRNKWGMKFEGSFIITPDDIKKMEYDYICIMTKVEFATQIRKQLACIKVPFEKVINFNDLLKIKKGEFVTTEVDDYTRALLNFDFEKEPGIKIKKTLNVYDPKDALITVITPFYNAGKFFEQTFNSVMNQTFPWFEWIIVNDGSTNEADAVMLKDFSKKDRRIKIINQENMGVSEARNTGFRNSKSEIVVPLDADDLISPQFLEYLYWGLYYNNDAAWAYTWSLGFYENEYLWKKTWNAEMLKSENFLLSTAAIRKKDWEEVGGYVTEKISYNEDWRFWLDMLSYHKKPVCLAGYLFWYRRMQTGRLSNLKKDEERLGLDREIIRRSAEKADGTVQAVEYPLTRTQRPYYKPERIAWDEKRMVAKNDKKRLLMIAPWMVMGGADQFNLDLLAGLSKEAYEVSIMTTIVNNNEWQNKFAEITDEIFVLPEFLDPAHYVEFVMYYIQTRKIDILLITNSTMGYYMLPLIRKEFPELCIIDYVHMEEWYWKAGGYARISSALGDVIDRTYVCNSSTRDVIIQHFGRKEESVKTIYIGVDEEKFNPAKIEKGFLYKELSVDEKRPIILFPCRVHPQKRPFMLLEIAELVKTELPEVLFVVVGDGPQLNELKKAIEDRGLKENIRCIGRCNQMEKCYADAKLTLICSIKEGLALTAYESCSMGVPVVSSAVGGQGDLVDSAVGGLIEMHQNERIALNDRFFDEKEVKEYAALIIKLLRDKEFYNLCSTNSRKRIVETFSIKKMVSNMMQELNELMNSRCIKEKKQKMAEKMQEIDALVKEIYTLELALEAKEAECDEMWRYYH